MKALKPFFMAASLLVVPACSQAGPADQKADVPAVKYDVELSDKDAIEQIIHDYLMENPEVVMDALVAYEAKQDWASVEAVRSAIYNDSRDVVIGPVDANVTIVEFFDYNCTYCKKTTDWLVNIIKEHPNDVRVIFKELPILDGRTQTSKNAARAALAAHKQGKYLDMHVALMNARGLSQSRIEEIAENEGLNVSKLIKDMEDSKINNLIQDNMVVGQKLRPLTGTPFFIIGDEFLSGANVTRLDEMLDKALNG
ncbi:MAG: DsbA family protein [Hellea sp.]|nr:DsbA family protein [Hellea sp.]